MNSDLRISTSMVNHSKVKKLIKKHGYEAFYSLVTFWSYVAINKPDGDISGLDADDIEIASSWGGEDGVFYDALCSIKFLDCSGESISIHNWVKHNPYAFGAEDRSLAAKKKQFLRWCYRNLPKKQHDSFKDWLLNVAKIDTNSNTDSILAVYQQYTNSNTPYPEPYPEPEPEPEPYPKDIKEGSEKSSNKVLPETQTTALRMVRPSLKEAKSFFSEKGFPQEAQKFFDYYTSNGWKVSKNPMKDWQAAARGWMSRSKAKPSYQKKGSIKDQFAMELLQDENSNDGASCKSLQGVGCVVR